jgi:hypothetical protein
MNNRVFIAAMAVNTRFVRASMSRYLFMQTPMTIDAICYGLGTGMNAIFPVVNQLRVGFFMAPNTGLVVDIT